MPKFLEEKTGHTIGPRFFRRVHLERSFPDLKRSERGQELLVHNFVNHTFHHMNSLIHLNARVGRENFIKIINGRITHVRIIFPPDTIPVHDPFIRFLPLLCFALWWKNFVFRSSAANQLSLDLWRQ